MGLSKNGCHSEYSEESSTLTKSPPFIRLPVNFTRFFAMLRMTKILIINNLKNMLWVAASKDEHRAPPHGL
jgi:hypothetical protein